MAILKIKTAQNSFSVNGTWYNKGALVIKESDNGLMYGGAIYNFDEVDCDGAFVESKSDLITWLNANLFKTGGGDGGGSQDISLNDGEFLVGTSSGNIGRKIARGDLNLNNAQILATHPTTGALTGIGWAIATTPNTVPVRTNGGNVQTADATMDYDAVNLGQLNAKVATTVPLVNSGTGSIGTSTLFARQDHVHPLQPSVATLTTGRTISITGGGTGSSAAFNGSANATIPLTLAVPTQTVRGGVLAQVGIPDLPTNAELADVVDSYNELLFILRTAGVLLP